MESLSTTMCPLQDRTKSDSEDCIDIDNFDFEKSSGWNDESELDRYLQNKDINKQLIKKLIYQANKLLPLSSIIFKHNIAWTITENQSGWTHKACCPFADHQDSTPSFGYNSKDDRFHCFGCHRSGNAVQFLAFLNNKTIIETAKEIILKFKSSEDIIIELDEIQSDKTDELLDEFSKEIRSFLYTHSDNSKALQYLEAVTWNLDVYLEKHTMSGTINFDSLQARIEKLREQLALFG